MAFRTFALVLSLVATSACDPSMMDEDPDDMGGKADLLTNGSLTIETIEVTRFATSFPHSFVALSRMQDDEEQRHLVLLSQATDEPSFPSGVKKLGRIESYVAFDGGMDHPVVYFVTNVRGGSGNFRSGRVFRIDEFSSPDDGDTAPDLTYSQSAVSQYVADVFLTEDGEIDASFTPDPDVEALLDQLVSFTTGGASICD